MSAMSDKDIGETRAAEELEHELADELIEIAEREKRVEKLKMAIRTLRPDFDFMDVIRKPLSELTSPINGTEEKPYRSEVEEDPILQAKRQEEFNN